MGFIRTVVMSVLSLCACASVFAQAPVPAAPAVRAPRTDRLLVQAVELHAPLKVDGRLDDEIYSTAVPISIFFQEEPNEGAPISEPTQAWVLFDKDHLYIAGRCLDDHPERWILNEMRRDIPNVSNNESFGVSIDTFHDGRNGFIFEVNALGGFLDGQITNEGFPPSTDWNPVWNPRSARFEGGWSFEMEIPFRSLRYGPGEAQVWGINMRRIIRYKNEESYIVPMPRSLGTRRGLMQLSLAATLQGLKVPPGSRNLELHPYGISTLTSDKNARPVVSNDVTAKTGLDVKYGITQNLTADFTVNTDFAQVEVDTQQVNLTRFNLVFPEKRTFFLESQGIFNFGLGSGANFAEPDLPTMFFSRQIGLSRGQAVPIDAGGRVTGKVGRFTLGALNIQTDDKPQAGALATNFTALRLRRDILRRSSIGAIYTGRSRSLTASGSNETFGADTAFGFGNNLTVNAFAAKTQTSNRDGHDLSYRGEFNYAGDRYGLRAERLVIQENFNPEVGFVRRPDLRKLTGTARFSPRPGNRRSRVRKWDLESSGTYIENHIGRRESREFTGTFGADFQNSDSFRVIGTSTFEFVPRPFALSRTLSVPAGGYNYANLTMRYVFGQQHRLRGTTQLDSGTFYAGTKTTAALSAGGVQFSSHVSVEPGVSLNWIDLPNGSLTTALIQARLIWTMTPRLFFTGLVQSNSVNSLVSTNLRLRWEYTPGSELFVVYTDERDTTGTGYPGLLNKAFVVKVAPLLRF